MKYIATIGNRTVNVELTRAAQRELDRRQASLLAEMELYFSCLIRKQVRFREPAGESGRVNVGERLQIRFRPVMTAKCKVGDYEGDEPPVTDFPITRPDSYIPKWLHIDYRNGRWVGEFGYIND